MADKSSDCRVVDYQHCPDCGGSESLSSHPLVTLCFRCFTLTDVKTGKKGKIDYSECKQE